LKFVILSLMAASGWSQDFVRHYWHGRFNAPELEVRPVAGLDERVVDGKLHLRIRDFLALVLRNQPDIQVTLLNNYTAAAALTGARAPFDPVVTLNFQTNRAVQSISGGGQFILPQTISSLNQTSSINYQQLLPTGQTIQTQFLADRSSGDGYSYPTLFGNLNFFVTQPLLQNRTNLQYLTPIRIAKTQIQITAKQNAATINNSLEQVAVQYWNAVLARDNINVSQQSLDLAKKSYDHDKLALDLGAISKLQILQSESSVADRERALVQAQYSYKVLLDGLRQAIGADLTAKMRDTEIVLDDDPSDLPDKSTILPFEEALAKAFKNRPEVDVAAGNLRVDELNAKASRDQLLPVVNLQAQGGASGPAFNPLSAGGLVGQVSAAPTPGLGATLQQILQFQSPSYGASLTATFPFHNPAAQQSLADALVSRAKNRYLQRQTQEQITLEVRQAVHNMELAEATIRAAIRARDLLRRNSDAEQQRYQLGDTSPFELLTSQSNLAAGESTLVGAYVSYQQAYIDYQRATETLLASFSMVLKNP
jgi:outer membrane protein TolC